MNWFEIVKSSPCVREAKQLLYEVLEKMGANDEMLREVKNAPEHEMTNLIENLQMDMSGKPEEEIFEKILLNLDRCEKEALINPIPQASMGQNYQPDFQSKLASEKIEKRGRKFDSNMELILERKLTSPKSIIQIMQLLKTGLEELNIERQQNKQRKLSNRGIPQLNALPFMLKRHPNIKVLQHLPQKTAKTYIWEE
jgi:hypothetical protein